MTAQYEILKANAEGVTYEVMQEWVKWVHPPQWMRDSVTEARNNLTSRSYLLDTVIFHATEKDIAVQNALMLVAEDTAGLDLELYRTWLDSTGGVWAMREMVNTYLYTGEFDSIENLFTNYDTLVNAPDTLDFKSYKDFALAYRTWLEEDSSVMRLDSVHLSELKEIATRNEHLKGTQLSCNILNFFYDSTYFTPAQLPEIQYGKKDDEEENRVQYPNKEERTSSVRGTKLKLYPNPANNILFIEYRSSNSNCVIVIIDIYGRILTKAKMDAPSEKTEINTQDYPNGIYLVKIDCEDGIKEKGKFSIMK